MIGRRHREVLEEMLHASACPLLPIERKALTAALKDIARLPREIDKVANLQDQIINLKARNQELRNVRQELQEALHRAQAPVKFEKLTLEGDGVEAVMAKGQALMQHIAGTFIEMLKCGPGNMITTKMHDETGREVWVIVQNPNGRFPAEIIAELEARNEALREIASYEAASRTKPA